MEQSPLTHQPRPEVFQPKIVQLYDELFNHPDDVLDEGFWTEFFLLRPDRRAFRQRINALTASDLLALEAQTRQLFARAVAILVWGSGLPSHGHADAPHKSGPASAHHSHRAPGPGPGGLGRAAWSVPDWPPTSYNSNAGSSAGGSGSIVENTLATLTTFLSAVLAKRYSNASADVIDMLAGLDRVDAVLSEFVAALDQLMRSGTTPTQRTRAVDVALAVTAGAYQTTLLTYFIQRDIFQAIVRVIASGVDAGAAAAAAAAPFTLIGLLANYNKFEFQNPYQLRLGDFVNEEAIKTILWGVGDTCQKMRAQYIDIQDDSPEGGWLLEKAWGMLGLGGSGGGGNKAPPKPVYDAETARQMLAELPGDEAPLLLATYDFTHANKLFSFNLVNLGPRARDKDGGSAPATSSSSGSSSSSSSSEPPIASVISLTSYLLQNAYRSPRATLYAHLSLMVFRLLVEDPTLCKRLCSSDDASRVAVRLCRQRAPHLPVVKSARPLAASILDAMVDGITHNLRKRLDVGLYTQCVGIMLRLVAYLSRTRTRLPYSHWPELFRALLSLARFLTTYAADLRSAAGAANPQHLDTLVDHVVNLLALSLSAGEAFLPTPAAYDDLFYKVVETGDVLEKFKAVYRVGGSSGGSMDTLLSVNAHYKQLLAEGAKGGKGGRVNKSSATLTSMQVAEVIRQGYETLSIQATEGLDGWDKYREADERTLLKKVARAAVADVKLHIEKD